MAQLRDTIVTGTLEVSNSIKSGTYGTVLKQDALELYGNSGQPTPFIDFHHNGDTGDYTHRIIAQANKQFSFICDTAAFSGGVSVSKNLSAAGNISCSGTIASGGNVIADFPIQILEGTGYQFIKWNSGRLELRQLITFTTPNTTNWSSYITTNYYYGNHQVDINPTIPFVSVQWWQCQMRSCGSNVGWVANSSAGTAKLNTTVVRNGNSGTVTIEFYVIGRWK